MTKMFSGFKIGIEVFWRPLVTLPLFSLVSRNLSVPIEERHQNCSSSLSIRTDNSLTIEFRSWPLNFFQARSKHFVLLMIVCKLLGAFVRRPCYRFSKETKQFQWLSHFINRDLDFCVHYTYYTLVKLCTSAIRNARHPFDTLCHSVETSSVKNLRILPT